MLRIIAGEYKGRRLSTPKGEGTRPTTDRVRESLMSSVISAFQGDLGSVDVLDAFAGTGAFGLEALSRGVRSCTFFEKDRDALKVLKANIATCGVPSSRCAVRSGDVLRAFQAYPPAHPFHLVFLDPPYALEASEVGALLRQLAECGGLADGCVVLYEHATSASGDVFGEGTENVQVAGRFEMLGTKTFGKTSVTTVRYGGTL